MPKNWNKGLTKYTHPSILKISQTMKKRKIDNFSDWRKKMMRSGKIKTRYPSLAKSIDLAELIGVTLGDGHIWQHPRTEELSIFSNSKNKGFVKRYAMLVEKLFGKKPTIARHGNTNCTRIRIYEKYISKRLGIDPSPRHNKKLKIPGWIFGKNEYIVGYLRGLYEAEGCLCTHLPTCTYKFLFANKNDSLLESVFCSLQMLGFHPHHGKNQIQISRKREVFECSELLQFRKY